ncbi:MULTISPECIES: 4a-hydroxytetrahydrobiopterin dehydratase [unclassified Streptomyces]|uniref:4a-hydroxytetrahydrobiopterin dehydratase n=1 Tax=unclassified Streptomyces TaxID=2593676 RepID=UPI000805A800|nr:MULTISPECIES: 4a-hydroxytetrahydrobiopterin dehydratase [unclassified Streptomyces]MYR73116.1 4a-hydroxytetrahydrobiopterin dehydratase [Streptomyces sp. SID4925]SBU92763.1 pterin-4-alpha-carbinolamine dehydratase [Streptomyces sp. OspMP-M45]
MTAEPLSAQAVETGLRELPGWRAEGGRITRTYRLPSHFAAAAFTVHVARIQDELGHHSELTLGYDTVRVAVNTHDAGGAITGKDLTLAGRIEAVAAGHGAT